MQELAPHAPLPAGFQVDDYIIESRLGKPGGFGITYAAKRRNGSRVALKELFPTDLVIRKPNGKVIPKIDGEAPLFREAMRLFRREAEILTQVRHENVVRVLDYLETMGTGYLVMRYEDGYDLGRHLKLQQPNRPNQSELLKLLLPLLDGLETVHRLDYLHRDIKPPNIYLTKGHKPVLIDFGSSKANLAQKSSNIMYTDGYSPYEMYFTDDRDESREGPFTDIYSMGVVIAGAILPNDRVPSALMRRDNDTFRPLAQRLANQEYSTPFLEAVDWALKFKAKDRPQNIADWRAALAPARKTRKKKDSRRVFGNQNENQQDSASSGLQPLYIGLAVVGLLAGILVILFIYQ